MPRQSTTPPENPADDASAAPVFVRAVPSGAADGGGKTRSLERLAALGLPIPPARVVTVQVWQHLLSRTPAPPPALTSLAELTALEQVQTAVQAAAWPAGFEQQLHAAVAELAAAPGLPPCDGFAVRSSGEAEDHDGHLAPGLYTSLVRVPAAGVAAAVRAVLSSYLTPAALAYATRHAPVARGVSGGGVLIHPFIVGTSFGICALAQPGGEALVTPEAEAPAPPTPAALALLSDAARTACAAHGPSELEWVSAGDRVVFLQLRAYRPPPAPVATAAPLAPEGWTWDAAHNPGPLSPAQAGLVGLVDARCHIGLRQQVLGGYLYYAPAAPPAPDTRPTAEEVRQVFEQVRAGIEQRLAALAGDTSLPSVLEVYLAGYQGLYGTLAPVLRNARAALTAFLAERGEAPAAAELLAGVPSLADQRHAAAAAIATAGTAAERHATIESYLRRFGDESGTWDVAAPTLREAPAPLLSLGAGAAAPSGSATERRAAERAAAIRSGLPASQQTRFDAVWTAARAAVAAGEDDDALFARLQAAVRRALLDLGRRLCARGALDSPDDVFFLPLTEAVALAGAATAPADLRGVVATNRRAWDEARRTPPALSVAVAPAVSVRGSAGSGGRALGRVVHHPPAAPLGPNAILVAAALLPTELPLLTPAAIVVETGGVLGHVAAQARERGMPAIVGATGARAALPEGALVLVDGDRGEIHRLS